MKWPSNRYVWNVVFAHPFKWTHRFASAGTLFIQFCPTILHRPYIHTKPCRPLKYRSPDGFLQFVYRLRSFRTISVTFGQALWSHYKKCTEHFGYTFVAVGPAFCIHIWLPIVIFYFIMFPVLSIWRTSGWPVMRPVHNTAEPLPRGRYTNWWCPQP